MEQLSRALDILVIDDDRGVRQVIQSVLEAHGMVATTASGSEEARCLIAECGPGAFDLILLDVSMPGQSGWEFLEELRGGGEDTPVIFLTAHQTVEDRVRGLHLGADDYVLKPFESRELVARVEAVVRRRREVPLIRVGDMRVDLSRREVERGGQRIALSPKEFEVLAALLRARGAVVSKHELLRQVWGIEFDPQTKTVEVLVLRLRRRLELGGSDLIQTVVGEGYRLVVPEPSH